MRFFYYLSNFLAHSLQRFRASVFPGSDWKRKKLRNSTYKVVKSCHCDDVNILNNAFWQYFTKLITKNLVLLFLIKTVIFKRVLTSLSKYYRVLLQKKYSGIKYAVFRYAVFRNLILWYKQATVLMEFMNSII